jgi:DNA-binding transcriptional ArsR family regulator
VTTTAWASPTDAGDAADQWTAMGDGTRRRVLALVAERPRSVAEIAERLPVSRPAVSQHLRILADSGLVTATPDGRRRIYRADPGGLQRLQAELEGFWSQALANLKRVAEDGDREGAPDGTSR